MPHVIVVPPRVSARLALALLPFLFTFVSYSQTPSASAAAAGSEPAAVNPTEVTVEVVAHDKKGNAVPDLTPAEVQITDAGVPVPLKSLRLAGETQETITFLFDQLVPGVAKTDRDLAGQTLALLAGHGYHFVVLKIEGRLHLVQAPTTDVEAVKAAIEAATMAKRPDYLKATEAAEKQITDDIDSSQGPRLAAAKALMAMLLDSQKTSESDAQSTPAVAALLAASRGQQDVPGRKAILYFSQGLDWHKNSPETLRDISRAANRARASIYSFDAEIGDTQAASAMMAGAAIRTEGAMGNMNAPGAASNDTTPAGTYSASGEFAGRMSSGETAVNSVKSLLGLCQSTGGAHVEAADGKRAAAEIAMNLNSYYLASWISPSSGDDTNLRPLGVRSLRKGVLLTTRSGYYPMRGGSVERVSGAETKLLAALAAPDLPTALPIAAALLRYGNTPDSDLNSVVVQVPLDRVDIKGGQGSVSVLAELKDQTGAVVRKFSEDVVPRQTQDMISFRRQFSAPPGEYVLETAAMDANGGKIGAERANVVIPALANGLALGDVVLVARIDPAGISDAPDPLRCSTGIVVPNLSGHISKGQSPKIDLFFHVHPDPSAKDAPALSAELRRDDVLVGTLPLKLDADPNRKTIPYLTTLGASSLSVGEYEMTIILSQGEQKVKKSVSFTLE